MRYFLAKQGFHSSCMNHSFFRIAGLVLKIKRMLRDGVVGFALGLICYMEASSNIMAAQMNLTKIL